MKKIAPGIIFFSALLVSWAVGQYVPATWTIEKVTLDVQLDEEGQPFYLYKSKPKIIPDAVPYEKALLKPELIRELNQKGEAPSVLEEFAYQEETVQVEGGTREETQTLYYQLTAKR